MFVTSPSGMYFGSCTCEYSFTCCFTEFSIAKFNRTSCGLSAAHSKLARLAESGLLRANPAHFSLLLSPLLFIFFSVTVLHTAIKNAQGKVCELLFGVARANHLLALSRRMGQSTHPEHVSVGAGGGQSWTSCVRAPGGAGTSSSMELGRGCPLHPHPGSRLQHHGGNQQQS